MNKPLHSLKTPSIIPVEGIIIESGRPIQNEGVNTTFVAKSLGETSVAVGYIEGFVESGNFSDIDSMEVYDGWRGKGIGSQLFMHFIQNGFKNNVKSISTSVANERAAHLMGTIPAVKSFDFSFDGHPLGEYSIEKAIEELEFRRKLERPDDPDIDEMLGTSIRITAHL